MTNNIFKYIIILFALSVSGKTKAKVPDNWLNRSIEQLMKSGFEYIKNNKQDSALYAFIVAGNKYSENMPDKEKKMAIHALNNVGTLCFSNRNDYMTSYKYLSKALDLCDKERFEDIQPDIELNMANLYELLEGNSDKAVQCYRRCYHNARKVGNWNLMVVAFLNICNTDPNLNVTEFNGIVYDKIPPLKITNIVYARLLYNGMLLCRKGEYAKARNEYHKMLKHIDKEYTRHQSECLVYKLIAKSFEKEQKYDSASVYYEYMHRTAERANLMADDSEACRYLSQCHKKMGNEQEANIFRILYLEKKDSLMNVNNLNGISNMFHKDEIGKVEHKMEEIAHKKQEREYLLVIIGIIAFIVIVFAFVLAAKNKRLRALNKFLYNKNVEAIAAETRERKRRKKMEEQIDGLENKDTKEKYHGSNLSDIEKDRIFNKVESVMNDISVICQSDFTIDTLAQMIDSKTKYVSQVINERYETSFSVLLSNCRVKEASRRMNDIPQYGYLTIEAISQSVGFRARASFIKAFKRVTGLTPSEYLREAKNREE